MLTVKIRSNGLSNNVFLMIGQNANYELMTKTQVEEKLTNCETFSRIYFYYEDKLIPTWFNDEFLKKILPKTDIKIDSAVSWLPPIKTSKQNESSFQQNELNPFEQAN